MFALDVNVLYEQVCVGTSAIYYLGAVALIIRPQLKTIVAVIRAL